MIVATAMLIFLLLIFMPIPFCIGGKLDFSQLVLQIEIKVVRLTFLKEKFFATENSISYQGTLNGDLQFSSQSNGAKEIVKCLTLDSVLLHLRNDFANQNIDILVAQKAIITIVSQVVCMFTHCQFACICESFCDVDDLQFCVKGSISVAELSFCLIKQGVQNANSN